MNDMPDLGLAKAINPFAGRVSVQVTVNGVKHAFELEPRMTLLDLLRERRLPQRRLVYARLHLRPCRMRSEALALASLPGTIMLAGGTELLNWMRIGIADHDRVLDIGRMSELTGIVALPDGGLWIGALARLNDVARHDGVRTHYPVRDPQ